jgi:phosphatidylglycerophosphate synthase
MERALDVLNFDAWRQLEYWLDPQPGVFSVYYSYVLGIATVVMLLALFIHGYYAERRWPDHYFKRRTVRSVTMAVTTISALAMMLVFNRQLQWPYVSMRILNLALFVAAITWFGYFVYYFIWRYRGELERWEAEQARATGTQSGRKRSTRSRPRRRR